MLVALEKLHRSRQGDSMRRCRATIIAASLAVAWSLTDSAAGQDLVGLYLTWSRDPTTTMTINWVDIYAGGGTTVWYRKYGARDWSKAAASRSNVGPTTLQLRRIELTNLQPGTIYEFGIGAQPQGPAHFWRFRTMPAELTHSVRFVAGGDMMHSRAMLDAMSRQAQRLDPDFAMFLGDLAYANGVTGTRWIDWLQSWKEFSVAKDKRLIPIVLGIGNHEVRREAQRKNPREDAPFFYSLFQTPHNRSYYVLDFGKYLSLILLDSEHTQPIAGAQAQWLEEALRKRADQKFVFVGYHVPAYGTTKAPSGGTPLDGPKAVAIRKNWVPHFERYGITAAFENDHHNFKRTYPLRNHRRDDESGILYLGDGAWGVVTREVPSPEVGWWLAKAEPRNHLWDVELHANGTALFQAIDPAGEVFDRFELQRARPAPVESASLQEAGANRQ
jgi:hypothetical protein